MKFRMAKVLPPGRTSRQANCEWDDAFRSYAAPPSPGIRDRVAAKIGIHGKRGPPLEIDGPDAAPMADPGAVARPGFVKWVAVLGIRIGAIGGAGCSSGDAFMPPATTLESGADAATSFAAPDANVRTAPDAGAATLDASVGPRDAGSSNVPMDAGQSATRDAESLGSRDSSTADAGGDEVDAGPYGWGDRTDIQEIFARYCFGCHGTTWQSCWSAQKNETTLTSVISSGTMPRNSTMSPMDKSALLAWLASGAPCAGPYQDAGNLVLPGGGATPAPL
jgi:hypothetical protein